MGVANQIAEQEYKASTALGGLNEFQLLLLASASQAKLAAEGSAVVRSGSGHGACTQRRKGKYIVKGNHENYRSGQRSIRNIQPCYSTFSLSVSFSYKSVLHKREKEDPFLFFFFYIYNPVGVCVLGCA